MPQDLSSVPWPIRTPRLTIRPARVADLAFVFEVRGQVGVAEWLPSEAHDKDAFVGRLSQPDFLAATLVLEHEGRVVGDLYLAVKDAWSQAEVGEQARGTQAEIGWVVGPEHAGNGFATEAAKGLLQICFEHLAVRRATAASYADNLPSRRVMEKLGMRREGYHVAEALHRSGRWLDTVTYALLAEEWRAGPGR